jgi:hypothetical protein
MDAAGYGRGRGGNDARRSPNLVITSILERTLMWGISSWSIVRRDRRSTETYFEGSVRYEASERWTAANCELRKDHISDGQLAECCATFRSKRSSLDSRVSVAFPLCASESHGSSSARPDQPIECHEYQQDYPLTSTREPTDLPSNVKHKVIPSRLLLELLQPFHQPIKVCLQILHAVQHRTIGT